MQSESVWEMRDWLVSVAARVQRRLGGYFGSGREEDAAHAVLLRAAEEGLIAAEVRRRAYSLVEIELDRGAGWAYGRSRHGGCGQWDTLDCGYEDGGDSDDALAVADASPLAHAFAAADEAEYAAAVLAGYTGEELQSRFGGRYREEQLRRRCAATAAAWIGRTAPRRWAERRDHRHTESPQCPI